MKGWHVGLIGFGAIATDVLSYLRESHADMRFTILRRNGEPAGHAHVAHVSTLEALVAAEPDIVVEAAGHAALMACAPLLLEQGISVVAASVGSLVQAHEGATVAQWLQRIAARGGARLVVPPGAIGGVDYIAAIARLPQVDITYTSRKPPQAWRDELVARGVDPRDLVGEYVLFEGSVGEAASLYPKNLNVAATLALAVGDASRIGVRVVVDSAALGNTHEIACASAAGLARFEFVNAPSPANPKTSLVTALSIAQSVEENLATKALRRAS